MLAKRKTPNMKLMEAGRKAGREAKQARLTRKEANEKNMVRPNISSVDHERQLKKMATKGVVALFNAITTYQRDSKQKEKKIRDAKSKDASKETKKAILTGPKNNMLKVLRTSQAEPSKTSGDAARTGAADAPGAPGAAQWNVLKDDFMIGAKMKDWDQGEQAVDAADLKRSKGRGGPEDIALDSATRAELDTSDEEDCTNGAGLSEEEEEESD